MTWRIQEYSTCYPSVIIWIQIIPSTCMKVRYSQSNRVLKALVAGRHTWTPLRKQIYDMEIGDKEKQNGLWAVEWDRKEEMKVVMSRLILEACLLPGVMVKTVRRRVMGEVWLLPGVMVKVVRNRVIGEAYFPPEAMVMYGLGSCQGPYLYPWSYIS